MRTRLVAFWMLLCAMAPAAAQVSIGIGFPNVSIGINLPLYPELVRVPGYPVYYAPRLNSNYFFYDGMYWVYQGDNWYASSWYNGPWGLVAPRYVPAYVLRVPVRYYRRPPAYFHGWNSNQPPRWGDHWGQSWQSSRSGWDRWDRKSAPAPAPLPTYQRQYSGTRYPQVEQQATIQTRQYRYQPQDPVAQQHYQQQRSQVVPAAQPRNAPPQQRAQPQYAPAPRESQAPRQYPQEAERHPQQSRESEPRGKGNDQGKGNDPGQGHEKEDKGKGHDR